MRTKPTKTVNVFYIDAVAMLQSHVNLVMKCDANETEMINPKYSPFKSNMAHEQVEFMDSFPCNVKTNPNEQVHAITVRSGKVLAEPEKKLILDAIEKNDGVGEYKKEHKSMVREYKPLIPYLTKLKKDCMNEQYDAQINKIFEGPLKNKRKLHELSTMELNEECLTIIQNKLPTKLKIQKVFLSVVLLYSRGIIKDVLVKVDKFIFPTDFIILEMDEDIKVPMILGQPFLATARNVIDVGNGKLVLRIGDEKVTLQACYVVRVSSERDDTCNFIDVSNHVVQRSLQEINHEDMLKSYPFQGDGNQVTSEERMVQLDELDE
ncbi:protein kinase 2B, chloroplastic-like [Gossypium australe]|uniref:Protein kinase 2B, chloroplastic-like n=1 Tax=Gossypium australe TaxID=47621 RepID=A0A5B6WPR0_9ROSI|nr:protein kinase 2B, chloroplastic-like [Gossypium australe]